MKTNEDGRAVDAVRGWFRSAMKCCADALRRALDALRRGYWAFAAALRFVVLELRCGFWAAVHVLRRALDVLRRGYWAFAAVLRWMLRAVRGAGGAGGAGGRGCVFSQGGEPCGCGGACDMCALRRTCTCRNLRGGGL